MPTQPRSGSTSTADHVTGASGHTSSKVPEITALFWVVKLLTTGMGETASDWLVVHLEPVLVVAATAVIFVGCLVLQLRASRYVVWRYWLLVALIGVFGTMVADVAHIVVGVPYAVSTGVFALMLGGVLFAWWRTERTLSIHSITTRRRELSYWSTVCATFALGTAAGDFAAHDLLLGYWGSAVLFAMLFVLPLVARRVLGWSAVATFWTSYIATRPLGASIADGLAVSPARGGIGLGTGEVTLVAAAVAVALVVVLARRDAQGRLRAAEAGAGSVSRRAAGVRPSP